MANYYKPKYKKWLRNERLVFRNKSKKIAKFSKRKWTSFKKRNLLVLATDQNVVTFEGKLRRESEKGLYKKSLIQKQVIKNFYGDMSEKQFKKALLKSNLYDLKAKHSLIAILESRLDVCLYRLNFVKSLYEARQLISHKHVVVNGSTITSKGYNLSPGDIIHVEKNPAEYLLKENTHQQQINKTFNDVIVNHMQADFRTMSAIFLEYPKVDEVFFPFIVSLKNIREFYNI
jgi:small subunit ribosomal protein S4